MIYRLTEKAAAFRSLLIDLVDAVRHSELKSETEQKRKELEVKYQKKFEALERLKDDINTAFSNLEVLPQEQAEELKKKISSFVELAIDQASADVNTKFKKEDEELKAVAESEKAKTIKSLESFLSVSPLHVIDMAIMLRLVNGTYSASARYQCDGDIEYEFSLNAADSDYFRGEFSLNVIKKKLRIPVRLSKNWLRGEPVPDFEKLEEYTLVNAEAAVNHILTTFKDESTNSMINIVYSRSNSEGFLTLEYEDAKGKVVVTNEPALNKHLDLMTLKSILETIVSSIFDLEQKKMALIKLTMDDKDILDQLDCFSLFERVWKLFVPDHKTAGIILEELGTDTVRERLKLLGEKADQFATSLGIQELT
ncbi:MAG: hypothetical protein QXQ39_05815 [Conexivisphaerales archaeon]